MIPLGDYNPTYRYRYPLVTYAIIAINVMVFLWETLLPQTELQRVFMTYSIVPYLVNQNPFSLETLLDGFRSMFFHASWAHVGFNMLYLFVFGDNIEDRLGRPLYVVFYILCGYLAVVAQVMTDTSSQIPLVGASGAIAGVLGGYFLLYPQARIRTILFYSITDVPAVLLLGFWFVSQLVSGFASLGVSTSGGGTAFFAHIGGFVAGWIVLYIHREVVGAPEMSYYNIGAGRRPPSRGFGFNRGFDPTKPQQIEPRPDLDPQARAVQQQRIFELLAAHNGESPIYLLTEGRAYYGRVVALDEAKVTLQEKTGQFVIPLENIARVG